MWGARPSSPDSIKTAVFTRKPPATEIDWQAMIEPREGPLAGDRIAFWLQRVSLQLVTHGVQRLWAQSVKSAMNKDELGTQSGDDFFAVRYKWASQLRANITATCEHSGQHTELDVEILRAIYKGVAVGDTPLQRYPATNTRFLLFFDGGSRGNQGSGSSCAVVVRLGDASQLVWMASMSYAQRTTTNNYAEYQGLCAGLSAAAQHGWYPLNVVGDSMMIIRQMSKRRHPKVHGLRALYGRARTIADSIRVGGWHHHYRSHNKMADKAANQAMDSCTSYQAHAVDNRKELAEIQEWMLNDVHHWLSNDTRQVPANGRRHRHGQARQA